MHWVGRKPIRSLALVAGFFWGKIQPVEVPSCVGIIQNALAAKIDQLETYEPNAFTKLLFLADGTDVGWGTATLGESVAKKFPDKTVVRADLLVMQPKTVGNLTVVKVDNTEAFPAEVTRHKYDMIVMREGMCVCCASHACGGVGYQRAAMGDFLERVASVLNTENPDAIAVLHARAGRVPSGGKQIIEQAASDVQARHPELQFDFNMTGNKIHSLMIRPRPNNELELLVP